MASKPTIGPVPQFLPAGQQASGTWDVIQATKVVGGTPRIIQGWILLPVVNADGVTTGFKVNK